MRTREMQVLRICLFVSGHVCLCNRMSSKGKRKAEDGAKLPKTTKKARNTKEQLSVQHDDWPEYFVSVSHPQRKKRR